VPLGANRYGKSEVRVVKLERSPDRHRIRDLTVDVMLEGDFEAVHTAGDNTGLVATDTMRNIVYAFAAERPLDSLPALGAALVEHLLGHERVSEATVKIREHPWERFHPHAFRRGSGGTRVHEVAGGGPKGVRHTGGVEDLLVLRTAESGFAGFERDRFTTLPETDDRIVATAVAARWEYGHDEPDEAGWAPVRDRLLDAFADHPSPSVQFTLNRMGEAVLDAHPEIGRIHLSLPNRHHLPVDVSRFGVEDSGEVFHATTEPFGLIEATVER
jgi:urate oxidase